jgi:hypothetical protein
MHSNIVKTKRLLFKGILLFSATYLLKNNTELINTLDDAENEFVVINGWVMLRKDLV